ncbi:MAG: heme o synthase [Lentisphaeria bacterium]|nr:heme o synthase [Lentisphaeria bacterium]
MVKTISHYIQLMKPSIMLLVVITGAAGLLAQGELNDQPFKFLAVLFALYCTGGCANALNQFYERNIDSKMGRTSKRRPLPTGKISPRNAFIFAVSAGTVGVLIFFFLFNWQSALISLVTILFYSQFYTLYLKPNTAQNIVIGGAAGAMAPVIAWVAAGGYIWNATPWILFGIIFLWTPPHFWALALYMKEDYVRVKLPMMPVVKGDESTLKQILVYTLALVACSLLMIGCDAGYLYLAVALILGAMFIKKALQALRENTRQVNFSLFKFSIVYLLTLFMAFIIESFLGFQGVLS